MYIDREVNDMKKTLTFIVVTIMVLTFSSVSYATTMGQKNALASAKVYLNYSPFSYQGLIKQLVHEKYSREDAAYGADNCGTNWNEQAAKKAETYLRFLSLSRDRLIDHLKFDGFTHEQAVYGVTANGY